VVCCPHNLNPEIMLLKIHPIISKILFRLMLILNCVTDSSGLKLRNDNVLFCDDKIKKIVVLSEVDWNKFCVFKSRKGNENQ